MENMLDQKTGENNNNNNNGYRESVEESNNKMCITVLLVHKTAN